MTIAERARRLSPVLFAGLMVAFLVVIFVLATLGARIPTRQVLSAGLRLGSLALPALVGASMLLAVALTYLAVRRWPRATLLVAVAAVIGIRLAIALAYEAPQVSDWRTYERLAGGFLKGETPFADRPMGWPVLLAAAWSLFGSTVRTGILLNVAMAGLTGIALAAWLRMIAGTTVAAVGVMAYAVFPSHVLWVLLLATEVPYTLTIVCLVLGLTWLLLPGRVHSRRVMVTGFLGIGLLLGASYWIRSTSIVLVPFVAALPFVFGPRGRTAIWLAVAVVAGTAITLGPIAAWNASVLGRPSISNSLYGGWQLFVGNNDRSGGGYNAADQAYLDSLGGGSVVNPYAAGAPVQDAQRRLAAVDDALFRAGIARLTGHGTGLPRFAYHKLDRAWADGTPAAWFAFSPTAPVANRKLLIAQLAAPGDLAWVLVLAGAALWYWRRRRDPGLTGVLVGGITLLLAALLLLLESQARYHEYIVPLLIGLAAVSWVEVADAALSRLRLRSSTHESPAGA